jgi:hypothetical protein
MKMLTTAIAGLVIALTAQVAQAYVVQVVTTVPLSTATSLQDPSQLGDDIVSAIRDVVRHVIAFTPTVIRIEDARVVGSQLYLVLLLADADGEALIEERAAVPTSPSTPDASDDDDTDEIIVPNPSRI